MGKSHKAKGRGGKKERKIKKKEMKHKKSSKSGGKKKASKGRGEASKRKHSGGGGGGGGPAAKKKLEAGFQVGKDQFYQSYRLQATAKDLRYVYPSGSRSDLEAPGGSALFEIWLGREEFVRFMQSPLILEYQVMIKNKDYNSALRQGKNSHEFIYCNPEDHPNIFLNSVPGVSSFIDRATISLNGKVLTDGVQCGSLSHVYKAMNKVVSCSEDRVRDDADLMQLSHLDRKGKQVQKVAGVGEAPAQEVVTYEPNESFKKAQSLVHHTDWQDDKPLMASTSLDGFPLLCRPRNNALAKLNKAELNEQTFLPPGSRISVMIHFRPQPEYMLDSTDQTDEVYFKSEAPDPSVKVDGKIKIKNIRLGYETFVPKSEDVKKWAAATRYPIPVDLPHVSTNLLTEKAQHVETNVFVPAGSRAVYLAFMYGGSLWGSKAFGRGIRQAFVFPKDITNVSLRLPDRGHLIHDRLGELRGKKAFKNVTLRNYWAALRESGVVDDDFTKFIASDDVQHPSYQQLLFADLRAYGVTENLNLRVTTSFEGTSVCPSNLYLVSCFVTEASLMKASDGEWSLDRVIGKKK